MKLVELGHPYYLTENSLRLSCSDQKENMHRLLQNMQDTVALWKLEVSELRARYPWLLYISTPKMLLLHKQINSSSPDIDAITHEVSFIIDNQKEVERRGLCNEVEVRQQRINLLLFCPIFAEGTKSCF